MLVVSIMTSTLTTRIKRQEQLRMESEKEKCARTCCARSPTTCARR